MSKRSPHHQSQDRILGTTYVYCMSNWPKVWVSKFGITDHTKRRVQNVSETTFGTAYHIIPPFNLAYGYWCEQFVHGLYFLFNAPFRKGSGRSEWYLNLNPITCLLVWMIAGNCLSRIEWGALALSPVIWLDGLFWLCIWWLVKPILAVLFMLSAGYIIIHL